jgi:hypothetical protein
VVENFKLSLDKELEQELEPEPEPKLFQSRNWNQNRFGSTTLPTWRCSGDSKHM